MDYNNYYPTQTAGHPPPPPTMQNQHGCSPVQIMPGASMMHNPGPPPPPQGAMVRQVVTPGLPPSHPQQMQMQQQQPPQHMAPHQMQSMPPQQHPPHHHANSYQQQQLPPHPPLSHSASPHPLQSPHPNHQTNLNIQPPSRPSTGPSPHHHMHQQSPHHMGGGSAPPIHVSQQPQQLNQMTASPSPRLLPPPGVNHHGPSQPGSLLPPPQIHNHNFMGPGGSGPPMSHPSPHYQPGPQQPPHNIQPGPPSIQMSQPIPPSSAYHPHGPMPHPLDRGSPFYQNISQTEIRILELNKRLQNRPRPRVPNSPLPLIETSGESYWWDKFACDFFDDESTLTLRLPSEDKPVEYTIGRTLIPRFFRSYYEGGVVDLSIKLRNTRETSPAPNLINLECDQADVTTKIFIKHPNTQFPINVVVHTEGHLSLDFISNNFDNLLIKSWRFSTMQCREYIDRCMTSTGLPNAFLIEPVTRHGLTKQTIAYLKMCMIMEPMQELMLTHRLTKMDPRSCLKDLLYNKYKLKNIDDTRVQPNKRRKRKTPAANNQGGNKRTKANANAQQAMNNNNMGFNNINNGLMPPTTVSGGGPVNNGGMTNMSLASQDVMVVGEPTMLGADFGDENERRITRLENNQFDSPNNINHSNTPNPANNNPTNGISQSNNLNQGQNQICNNNQNLNQTNNLSHIQQQPQQSQQLQNNHDTGNMQMMNHSSSNGSSNINSNGNSNNNGTSDPIDGTSNINGDDCAQNNNNTNFNNMSIPMSPMHMNGNMNHTGHLVKTETDLKQQAHSANDTEAR